MIEQGTDSGVIDPQLVPVYPVVRMEIRPVGEEGLAEGFENGVQICSAMDPVQVKDLLVQRAATVAAGRPGAIRAVRAIAIQDGQEAHLVITADGEPIDAAAPRRASRSRRRVLIGAGAGVVMIAMVAAGVHLSHQAQADLPLATPTHTVVPTPAPTQLPVLAPAGWSSQAAWSSPLGQQGASAAVGVTPQGVVAAPSADGSSVVARRVSDGVQLWSASVGDSLSFGPVYSQIGSEPAVVAASSSSLSAWSPVTGKALGRWDLPQDGSATVQATPAGVVVLTDGQHALIIQGTRLVPRVLPAGATAAAPSGTALVVAGGGLLWKVTGDRLAPAPIKLAGPAGTSWSGVVGASSSLLVAAYTASSQTDASTVVLRGFDLGTGQPRWTTAALPSATAGGAGNPLLLAPSQGWGVYGSSALNLSTGKVTALPTDWSTTAVGDDLAFGTTASGVGQVSPQGMVHLPPTMVAATGATTPTPPVAVSGGTAFIAASDGQDSYLYAVRQVQP